MDTETNDRDFQYDESGFEPPFVTFNCSNDEIPNIKVCFFTFNDVICSVVMFLLQTERQSTPFTGTFPENVKKSTMQQCRCHPVFKFAQSVMDQLPVEQQKKFTIDVTKLLLKYQESNLE